MKIRDNETGEVFEYEPLFGDRRSKGKVVMFYERSGLTCRN